jgi:hypothetical protein
LKYIFSLFFVESIKNQNVQEKSFGKSTPELPARSYYADDVFNMVVEIPKNSKRKYEMSKTLAYNPLIQDRFADGTLRYFKNGPIHWNYGFLPQTWVSPYLKIENFLGKLSFFFT